MLCWLDSEKGNSRAEYCWTEDRAPFAKPAKDAAPRLAEAEPQARCCVTRQPRLREKELGRVLHPPVNEYFRTKTR